MAMLDRSNVGFVKQALQISANIGDTAFALGAGIFFIGYAVFEIPSNLMLHRFGAKIWLSRIMITWGLASAAMMFVRDEWSFYVLRFILGVAEAGFSPGVILYSTYWFPAGERSKALGVYYFGAPIAMVFGGPVSGLILDSMKGFWGFQNWQWMFLIEGLAASVVGVIAYFYLVSQPRDAAWLTAEERGALEEAIEFENHQKRENGPKGTWSSLLDFKLLRFVLIYFAIQVSAYGVVFYLPSRVSELTGQSIGLTVGLLTAIPWLCALLLMGPITTYADAKGRHFGAAVVLLIMTSVGILSTTMGTHLVPVLIAFCVATVGFVVVQPIYWTLPTSYLSGTAAASGIAWIGSLGNLGGLIAPTLKNAVEKHFQNPRMGMLALASAGLVGMLLMFSVRRESRR